MTCRAIIFRWIWLLILGLATWSAQPQVGGLILLEAPRQYSLRLTDIYLQTDAQFDRQLQENRTTGATDLHQRLVLEQVVGVGAAGWVYHPNLLEYVSNIELGGGYQDARVDPGKTASDLEPLLRYHFAMDLLKQKPYYTSVFADKDLTYRDYDFFSHVRVDSQRFGAHSGYAAGAVPLSISFQHYDEDVQDPTRPAQLTEDTLNFNSNNLRRSGKATTQLSYYLDRFSRRDDGFSYQRGLNQNLSVVDTESFGDRDWIHLSSLLNYSSVTESPTPSDKLLLQEQLQLEHTSRLRSFYDYSFDNSSSSGSDASTHQGRVGLGYQLFDNLSSTLDAHGNLTQASAPGSFLDTTRYGLSLNETYTRALGDWGNISLGYMGTVDHEERNASGAVLPISQEAHTLIGYDWVQLNKLSVVEVLSVNATNGIAYQLDSDYLVRTRGVITEIRRKEGGNILDKSVVLVDYTIALDPSGQYNSYANGANFRLDFWKGLFAIYGRWTTLDYSGGEELTLRRLDDKIIGADSAWRWLRVGAEYEVADSNFLPYDRSHCFQSVVFRASDSATFGVDLDESWTTWRDTNTRQTAYGMIARYQQRLTATLALNAEGGMRRERGDSFDGDYASARTELIWAVAKLNVKLGYEYGNESHPNDRRDRQYFYLRLRRSF